MISRFVEVVKFFNNDIIGVKLDSIDLNIDIEVLWEDIRRLVYGVVKGFFGYYKFNCFDWFVENLDLFIFVIECKRKVFIALKINFDVSYRVVFNKVCRDIIRLIRFCINYYY